MARQQVQLPGIIQAQPVARPVDTFTGAKLNSPIPKEILDLSKFSSAIAEWVGRGVEEQKQRSIAAGKADVELGRAYGSGLIDTPDGEKSRKDFKELQKKGEILASQDPWYRIAVFSAEGRRVGLTVQDEVLSEKSIREMSQPVNAEGDFQPYPDNINEEFDRRIQPFLNAPALKTIYAQRAAADVIQTARAAFHEKVTRARDANLQRYYEDEAITQLTSLMETAHDAADSDPETRETMIRGFEHMKEDMLLKANVPEPRKVLHAAYLNYINHALDRERGGPEEALRRLDFIRALGAGPGVSVLTDDSVEGIEFRASLEKTEVNMTNAEAREASRMRDRLGLEKETATLQFERQISEMFAATKSPEGGLALVEAAAGSVDVGLRTLFLTIGRRQYDELSQPTKLSPARIDEVNDLLARLSPDAVDQIIDTWGDVSDGNKQKLHAYADQERKNRLERPAIAAAYSRLEATQKSTLAGRSPEAASKLGQQFEDLQYNLKAEIRTLIGTFQGDQAKLDAEIDKKINAYDTKSKELTEALRTQEKDFDTARQEAWSRGQSFLTGIGYAYEAGTISETQFNAYVEKDKAERSAELFVKSAQEMVGLFAKQNDITDFSGPTGEAYSAAYFDAEKKAREWFRTERKNYASHEAAMEVFSAFRRTDIDPAIRKAFEGAKAEKASTDPLAETAASSVGDAINKPLVGTTVKQRVLGVYKDRKGDYSTRRYVEAWGSPDQLGKVRKEAKQEAARLLQTVQSGEQLDDPSRFKDIMRTGIASFDELRSGKVQVNESIWGGVTPRRTTVTGSLDFGPQDIDPWDTPVAKTRAEFEKLLEFRKQDLIDYAATHGITGEKYSKWEKYQILKIAASEGKYN